MILSYRYLNEIASKVGNSYYILDTETFEKNYDCLITSFRNYYKKTIISYSYKTNYIPEFCKIIGRKGGYAEVVSDMEYQLAKHIGVPDKKIIYNGPYKNSSVIEKMLLGGGAVNIDSLDELKEVLRIAEKHKDQLLKIGMRCNFNVGEGTSSRFGINSETEEFEYAINLIHNTDNLNLVGIHCHYSSRSLKIWVNKIDGLIKVLQRLDCTKLEYISIGGGLYGEMKDELKQQFSTPIPTFDEYASTILPPLVQFFAGTQIEPVLFIEPGSALAGNAMKYVCKVMAIKNMQNHFVANTSGSMYNINPTLSPKRLPMMLYGSEKGREYIDISFAGYTCIESDYLYKNFKGRVCIGDFLVFDNVGSYSVVLKPPFILPNVPVIHIGENGEINIEKRAETFEDIFSTYLL